jgi:hypothetical protein
MDLQDEILSKPKGILAGLARQTGLCELTIIRCVHRVYCGSRAAKKIAAAFGKPKRWPELVKEKGPK